MVSSAVTEHHCGIVSSPACFIFLAGGGEVSSPNFGPKALYYEFIRGSFESI